MISLENKNEVGEETREIYASWFSFYNHLYNLWKVKDEAYLNNDLESWFKALNRMYVHISFKLNVEEKNEIDKLINISREHIKSNRRLEATEILHRFDLKIIGVMNNYNMIFPKIKAIKGGREKIEDRYKDIKNFQNEQNEEI